MRSRTLFQSTSPVISSRYCSMKISGVTSVPDSTPVSISGRPSCRRSQSEIVTSACRLANCVFSAWSFSSFWYTKLSRYIDTSWNNVLSASRIVSAKPQQRLTMTISDHSVSHGISSRKNYRVNYRHFLNLIPIVLHNDRQ